MVANIHGPGETLGRRRPVTSWWRHRGVWVVVEALKRAGKDVGATVLEGDRSTGPVQVAGTVLLKWRLFKGREGEVGPQSKTEGPSRCVGGAGPGFMGRLCVWGREFLPLHCAFKLILLKSTNCNRNHLVLSQQCH